MGSLYREKKGWGYRLTTVLLLCLVIMSGCGGPWRDRYLDKGLKTLTQDEIAEKFGPPSTAKTPVLGGNTVWTYRVPMGDREVHPWGPQQPDFGKKNKSRAVTVAVRKKLGRKRRALSGAVVLLSVHIVL